MSVLMMRLSLRTDMTQTRTLILYMFLSLIRLQAGQNNTTTLTHREIGISSVALANSLIRQFVKKLAKPL